jgi:threonine synthase
MGLPTDKLIIATNENDILHRFWRTGHYEKKPVHGREAEGGFVEDGVKAHEDGVKETLAPAMDILVSSNFERLLWYLALQQNAENDRAAAGAQVKSWLEALKTAGGFGVEPAILSAAKQHFSSERVSDSQTLSTIKDTYLQPLEARRSDEKDLFTRGSEHDGHYILDPHTAIGVAGALRSISAGNTGSDVHHLTLATAHPAKFSHAVELALRDQESFSFETVLPVQLQGLEKMERRVKDSPADWKAVREIVRRDVEEEKKVLAAQ